MSDSIGHSGDEGDALPNNATGESDAGDLTQPPKLPGDDATYVATNPGSDVPTKVSIPDTRLTTGGNRQFGHFELLQELGHGGMGGQGPPEESRPPGLISVTAHSDWTSTMTEAGWPYPMGMASSAYSKWITETTEGRWQN